MRLETDTRIGTLRLRGAKRDDPALRLAVSSQMKAMEVAPGGLPPSAILIVRKVTDPLPGRIGANRKGFGADLAWQRALQDKLEELYRRARRPTDGILPGKPDAVVFHDEAELLACLLGDLASGDASYHWWWRLILKSRWPLNGTSACMRQLLVEKPRLTPAVMGYRRVPLPPAKTTARVSGGIGGKCETFVL